MYIQWAPINHFHSTDLINQDPVTIKGNQVGLHHLKTQTHKNNNKNEEEYVDIHTYALKWE